MVASSQTGGNQQQQTGSSQLPGFQLLGWLLVNHTALPEIFHLLIGLTVGKVQLKMPPPSSSHQLDQLDNIWSCLFGLGQGQPVSSALGGRPVPVYCPEAITVLLAMMRAIMNPEVVAQQTEANYPNVLLQFFFYVYNNSPDYMAVFMTPDILNAMVASLFPIGSGQQSQNSEPSTPVLLEENRQFVMVDVAGKEPLTFHAAKKTLMDFLRTIVIDSLSLPVSSSGNSNNVRPMPIIDVIMDACPDSASYAQHCQFQTELLSIVMEYLSSAGVVVLGEQGVLPVVTQNGGSLQNVAPNVFYLAGRLVDKLWQGILGKDPHLVLDFIVQLITQAKKRRTASTSSSSSGAAAGLLGPQSLDNIYRCLNRCVLYILSRPAESVSEQMSILEALHKLTTHRYTCPSLKISFSNLFLTGQEFGVWVRQPRPGFYRLPLLLSPPADNDVKDIDGRNPAGPHGTSVAEKKSIRI